MSESGAVVPAGAATAPAVAMRGITKRFPGVLANDAVDFQATVGEVHALLGENGAGKSTLSNILTGLYQPDAGTIELWGEPTRFAAPRDALAAGVSMVHQHFRLVEPFTVAENVAARRRAGAGGELRAASARGGARGRCPRRALRPAGAARRARSGSSPSASSSASRSSRRCTATRAS